MEYLTLASKHFMIDVDLSMFLHFWSDYDSEEDVVVPQSRSSYTEPSLFRNDEYPLGVHTNALKSISLFSSKASSMVLRF